MVGGPLFDALCLVVKVLGTYDVCNWEKLRFVGLLLLLLPLFILLFDLVISITFHETFNNDVVGVFYENEKGCATYKC